jgi:cytosine/adenosine deaminase-related metal-dependent hydrolase
LIALQLHNRHVSTEGITAKARELITVMLRQNCLAALAPTLQVERQKVDWPNVAALSSEERLAWTTATKNAARVCNLGHELGTFKPGKLTDVFVVNGDPLQNTRALAKVRLVFHNGVMIRQ